MHTCEELGTGRYPREHHEKADAWAEKGYRRVREEWVNDECVVWRIVRPDVLWEFGLQWSHKHRAGEVCTCNVNLCLAEVRCMLKSDGVSCCWGVWKFGYMRRSKGWVRSQVCILHCWSTRPAPNGARQPFWSASGAACCLYRDWKV